MILQGKSHNHHTHRHHHLLFNIFMIMITKAAPVIVEDVNAVVVELVCKEGVRDKELANRDGQNEDHVAVEHDHDHELSELC